MGRLVAPATEEELAGPEQPPGPAGVGALAVSAPWGLGRTCCFSGRGMWGTLASLPASLPHPSAPLLPPRRRVVSLQESPPLSFVPLLPESPGERSVVGSARTVINPAGRRAVYLLPALCSDQESGIRGPRLHSAPWPHAAPRPPPCQLGFQEVGPPPGCLDRQSPHPGSVHSLCEGHLCPSSRSGAHTGWVLPWGTGPRRGGQSRAHGSAGSRVVPLLGS